MKKQITLEYQTIQNIGDFLRSTEYDEIVVLTSRVKGGWHDVEFSANRAGFSVSRFRNPEFEKRRMFSECYRFTRKK